MTLLGVDLVLQADPPEVGERTSSMRPLKDAGEVRNLLEGRQVLLVAARDQHLVQVKHEVLHRYLTGLIVPSKYL